MSHEARDSLQHLFHLALVFSGIDTAEWGDGIAFRVRH